LLQSHPGDIFGDADQVENRRDDLHHDVEENVSKLNLLTKKEANRRADNKWEGSFKGTIFTKAVCYSQELLIKVFCHNLVHADNYPTQSR